jgi:hypothetical protein
VEQAEYLLRSLGADTGGPAVAVRQRVTQTLQKAQERLATNVPEADPTGADDGQYFEQQVRKAADPDAAIDSSLDIGALVANMAELASLAPSWRDHVPHEVAVHFNSSETYQEKYGQHVDSCALCQQLIEALSSRDDVLATFMQRVPKEPQYERTLLNDALEDLVRQLFGPGRHPNPMPTPASAENFDKPIPMQTLRQLQAAEHSLNPLDQFGAVETYLRLHRPEFAYVLIARNLEKCGLDHQMAARIGNAPRVKPDGVDHLLSLAQEQQDSEMHDLVRAIEVSAQLGDHAAALRQIRDFVVVRKLAWRGGGSAMAEVG